MKHGAKKSTAKHEPRSIKDGPYAWLSQAAIIRARSAAGYQGLALLVGLASRAPVGGEDFKASVHNLAAASGLSVRTVHRLLPRLAQARVIALESGKRKGEGGVDVANTYRLLRVHLSFAEGGTSNRPTSVPAGHTGVPSRITSLAEDRDISAQRQREISPPAAASGSVEPSGCGGNEFWSKDEQ